MPAHLAKSRFPMLRVVFRFVMASAFAHSASAVCSTTRAQSTAAQARKRVVVVLLASTGPTLATSTIVRSPAAGNDTIVIQDGRQLPQALASSVFALIVSAKTDTAVAAVKRSFRMSQPLVPAVWSANGEMRRAAIVAARLRARPSFVLPGRGSARSIVLQIPKSLPPRSFQVGASN